jgi:hypothetical protein
LLESDCALTHKFARGSLAAAIRVGAADPSCAVNGILDSGGSQPKASTQAHTGVPTAIHFRRWREARTDFGVRFFAIATFSRNGPDTKQV